MSYSFSVRGATVAAAIEALAPKFDDAVIAGQPVHKSDRDAALGAATAMAKLLGEPAEGQEVAINVAGWLQWRAGDGVLTAHDFTGASVSVQASFLAKAE